MKGYRITLRGKMVMFSLIIVVILIIIGIFCTIFSKQFISKKTVLSGNIVSSIENKVNKSVKNEGIDKEVDKPLINIEPVKNSSTELTNLAVAKSDGLDYPVEAAYFNDGKKVAFLTFDDGPSIQNTDKILDILKNYNIKATFFIVGSSAEKNPEILKHIVADGNSIGNHSYTHNYNDVYASTEAFMGEVKKTDLVIQNILGEKYHTRVFRFPGGSFEAVKQPFRQELVKEGYTNIDWNALSGDGEGTNIAPNKLFDRFVNTSAKQQHLVILMHDSPTKKTTVEVLPKIIDYLKAQGYEFATLK